MKRHTMILALLLGVAILATASLSVAGPRGGGAARGGAVAHGSGGGAAARGGAVHSYGGNVQQRSSAAAVGPRGGTAQAGRASGSYTTRGGSTVNYAGAGAGRTTPGGYGGRAVGGVNVNTPGGREVSKVGHAGGVSGPGGRAVGGRESVSAAGGPRGTAVGGSRSAAAVGPHGAATASRGAAVTSGGAHVAGASRGAVAAGGYGVAAGRSTAVAGGYRGYAAAGRTTAVARQGTYYRSSTAIRSQGAYVHRSVSAYPCFRAGWYRQPGVWAAAGWAAGSVWRAASWDTCSSYCSTVSQPVYYDYGSNVSYEEEGVFFAGEKVAGVEEYARQATELAETGREARASKDEEWLPLGVFAMVQGEEKTSNHIFQLAVNKKGVIRGNYYDAVTDSNSQVYGSVDRKTQRAAWTVGDRKTPVYEAGIANLTRGETTMMVHYGKDRSVQFLLIRIEQEQEEKE